MISRTAIVNIVFYTCLVAAAAAGAIIVLKPELEKKESLRAQRDAVVATNDVISAQAAYLRQQRQGLDSENPDSIRYNAHKRGLVEPGEVVYKFEVDP